MIYIIITVGIALDMIYLRAKIERRNNMSFIIKGIDLPENFEAVAIITKNTTKGEPLYNSVASYYGSKNVIQIPKGHGRLIDGDKLRATLRRWTEDEWNQKASPVSWAYAYEDIINLIDDAHTIVESEEE